MEIEQCSTGPSMDQGRNKKEIKDFFLKLSENDHITYPNLWGTMKAVLKGKFIAPNAYIKKMEKYHTSKLTEHLKSLEQKDANSPRRTRKQEIIKLRAEINKIEAKKIIQRISETKNWFIKKINKIDKPISKPIQKTEREYPN